MSTQRGSANRTRPQKYKNRTAFKNDLHDKTPQVKKMNSMHICEVCAHCKSVIEWKIKYKKYKPLTQAKTCTKCGNRTVKKAYHVVCRDCALKEKICAKCLKHEGDGVTIEPAQPDPVEQMKLEAEMKQLIKSLPERKRRTFMRYMRKGKENSVEAPEENVTVEGEEGIEGKPKQVRMPHTKEDLLKKIEMLRLNEEDDFCDLDSDEEFDENDFGLSDESS